MGKSEHQKIKLGKTKKIKTIERVTNAKQKKKTNENEKQLTKPKKFSIMRSCMKILKYLKIQKIENDNLEHSNKFYKLQKILIEKFKILNYMID